MRFQLISEYLTTKKQQEKKNHNKVRQLIVVEKRFSNAANLSTSQKAQKEDDASAAAGRCQAALAALPCNAAISIPHVITFNCYCNCKLQPKRRNGCCRHCCCTWYYKKHSTVSAKLVAYEHIAVGVAKEGGKAHILQPFFFKTNVVAGETGERGLTFEGWVGFK